MVPVLIYFDGGCEPNPGQGYGSFEIVSSILNCSRIRQKFGPMTCNQAEYNALLCALEELAGREDQRHLELLIYTDSQLLVHQLKGQWRCRKETLSELRDRCLTLLLPYAAWDISWAPRAGNVARFGH